LTFKSDKLEKLDLKKSTIDFGLVTYPPNLCLRDLRRYLAKYHRTYSLCVQSRALKQKTVANIGYNSLRWNFPLENSFPFTILVP
jgi:hypothetical protein